MTTRESARRDSARRESARRESASAALARIDALHSALTGLVLEGGDLDRIAAEAARVLGIGVLTTSTGGRERAAALTDEMRAALTEAGMVGPTGRFRSRAPAPTAYTWKTARRGCSGSSPGAPIWPG